MKLRDTLDTTALWANPAPLSTFQNHIDPAWIEQALDATGTASVRKRRLPAEQVIWMVLGMGLFRDRSISDVVDKLDLTIPAESVSVTSSAVAQARQRLGDEPMQWLFNRTAHRWAHKSASNHRWRDLALYSVDGSTFRLPDTAENAEAFGYPKTGRSASAHPQVRLVALMALRSHLVAGVRFGPFAQGEHTLATPLFEQLPERSLTIVDKNFLSAGLLTSIQDVEQQRHWLIRAKKNTRFKKLRKFADGDYLVEMKVSPSARKKYPHLGEQWQARAVEYHHQNQTCWVLTSLTDVERYPAEEIVELVAERWEIEQGYDEIKTEMLNAEVTLRSKSPEAIRQELWGILLAYNLVRLEMERIADQAEVAPTRISFITSLRFIKDEWLWCAVASPGAIPRHLKRLREDIQRFILPPRRRHRSYRREVKIKMSSYPRKRRSDDRAP